MAGKFLDGGDKAKENEKFNPYNLFLILILLILSQDVLQMIKAQKLKIEKKSSSNNPGRRVLNIFAAHDKKEVERQNKEPKEETKDNE